MIRRILATAAIVFWGLVCMILSELPRVCSPENTPITQAVAYTLLGAATMLNLAALIFAAVPEERR